VTRFTKELDKTNLFVKYKKNNAQLKFWIRMWNFCIYMYNTCRTVKCNVIILNNINDSIVNSKQYNCWPSFTTVNEVYLKVHFNRHTTPTTPTEIIFLERIRKRRDNVVTSPLYKCQGRIAIYRAGPRYVSWPAVSILYRYIAISSYP